MKFLFFITTLVLHCTESFQDNSIRLLHDFVNSKNIMLTLNSCWNKDKLLEFLQIASYGKDNAKFVSVHKQFSANMYFPNNLVIMDINNCEKAWSLLLKLNQTNSFISPTKYFIMVDNVTSIVPVLQNFTIYPGSDVVIAEKYGYDFKLHGVYRINGISQLIWEKYGYWSANHGLLEYLKRYPPSQRRHNLRKENLKVMIRMTDNDTWNHLDDFRHASVDSSTKLSMGSTICLLDYCNANVTYVSSEYFGYADETGKFNGIVAALINEEIDTSGTAMYPTRERVDVISFMTMQSSYKIKFILKKPPLSYVRNIFAAAFAANVWIVMVAALTAFGVVCYFIYNLEAKHERMGFQDKLSSTDVILISLEVLSQQGTSTDPQRISGRILAWLYFLGFFFIFVVYSGNIVAMLQAQVKLMSRKELLTTRMEIGAEDNNYMRIYVSKDTDEVGRQIYQKIGANGYYKFDEGMKKVQNGYFAYQVELGEAYDYILANFTNDDMCSLQEIDGYFHRHRGHSVTRKKSPYKEIFKTGFSKIDEYGLKLRNYNRWCVKPVCHAKRANYESVGLTESRMAFLLLIYGTLVALLFLLLEKIAGHAKKKYGMVRIKRMF